jgi:apolipoprotein N-acyltransferase
MAKARLVSIADRRTRWIALALYAVVTPLSFPHELPGGGSIDLGIGLVWFGPAALIVGLAGLTPLRAARAAFLASLAGHALLFHWFYVVSVVYGGIPAWLGLFSPLLPSLYVSIFTAAFAWLWVRVASTSRVPIVLGACLWVVIDWLRGHFLGGFPWATLGYALHLDLPLLGWTRWTGVYFLSFLAAAVGLAIGRAILDPGPSTRRGLVLTAVALVLAHGVGSGLATDDIGPARIVRIAAVQGNIDQGQKWDAERRERILETYLRLSEDAASQGARWLVWPETAVPGVIETDPVLRARLESFARRHEVTLVVGATGVDVDREARRYSAFYDSAFLVDPAGRLRDRYDKTHLVPFGEFVPLRGLLGQFFQAIASGMASMDVSPGPAPRTIAIESAEPGEPPFRVGVPICYELLFPDLVRRFAAQGAGVLLAITNDAWYGRTGAPHQFLAMTAMRSAEIGRWTVRAANTGISAIIDARGRVRQSSALFEEAVLVADVPVSTATDASDATFYARFGDVFAGLCLLVSGVEIARRMARERRRSAATGTAATVSKDGPDRDDGHEERKDREG